MAIGYGWCMTRKPKYSVYEINIVVIRRNNLSDLQLLLSSSEELEPRGVRRLHVAAVWASVK